MNEIEPDLNHCITGLAWRDPEFAAALMRRLIAMTRINIYPMSEEEITELIDRLGDADLPPIETIPWEELSHRLADKLSDSSLVERVREFEPFEAFLSVSRHKLMPARFSRLRIKEFPRLPNSRR